MSDEYDNSYDNIDNYGDEIQPYIDSFEQYDIAAKIVYSLREYILSHGLDMLTSNNAVSDMIMLF